MERSAIRGRMIRGWWAVPDYASLHPG